MNKHSALTIFDDRLHSMINPRFDINVLDETCDFSEGPVWNGEGYYLFSDIPRNLIARIAPGEKKQTLLSPSGFTDDDRSHLGEQVGSNGLAYHVDGRLLICQHGNGAVASWKGKEITALVANYGGRRFNSPNDLVVHQDGSVFFSDPPYGLKDSTVDSSFAQPVAGVYCYRDGETKLVTDAFKYPNGVCLSVDHRTLYCCSNKPTERYVLQFDAATLESRGVLCEENGDGIKCDPFGNLWLCTKEGVLIVDGQGRRLGLITLPAIPANCCWGGTQGNDLLITARQFIYHIPELRKDH